MLVREKSGTSVKSCGAYAECYSRYRESEAAFEGHIVAAANLLVDNHCMTEHNSGFGMGDLITCLSWMVCFASITRSLLHMSLRSSGLLLLLQRNFRC
jgi:hypothetical protein